MGGYPCECCAACACAKCSTGDRCCLITKIKSVPTGNLWEPWPCGNTNTQYTLHWNFDDATSGTCAWNGGGSWNFEQGQPLKTPTMRATLDIVDGDYVLTVSYWQYGALVAGEDEPHKWQKNFGTSAPNCAEWDDESIPWLSKPAWSSCDTSVSTCEVSGRMWPEVADVDSTRDCNRCSACGMAGGETFNPKEIDPDFIGLTPRQIRLTFALTKQPCWGALNGAPFLLDWDPDLDFPWRGYCVWSYAFPAAIKICDTPMTHLAVVLGDMFWGGIASWWVMTVYAPDPGDTPAHLVCASRWAPQVSDNVHCGRHDELLEPLMPSDFPDGQTWPWVDGTCRLEVVL